MQQPLKNYLFIFASCFIFQTLNAQTTYFVMPTAQGNGDGSSWANASADLQKIINSCQPADAVWVAKGTYLPTEDPSGSTTPSDPREKTFYLKEGVEVYGGFRGTESHISERDWIIHQTILSGDLNRDDAPNFVNNGDNAYHVVLSVLDLNSTVLDGFSIVGGNANRNGSNIVEMQNIEQNSGAGMYNHSTNLRVLNCSFLNNFAERNGAGVCNYGGEPIFETALFSQNEVNINNISSAGGGMHNFQSNAKITKTKFSENLALTGGAISNYSCSPNISGCSFSLNGAANYGGAIFNNSASSTITHCNFRANYAKENGGAIHNTDISPAIISESFFEQNEATNGGAIANDASDAIISNVSINNNNAQNSGGGIYNKYSHTSIENVILIENFSNNGGGIFNLFSHPNIHNCVLDKNKASNEGGGMYNYSASPDVSNCVFNANRAGIGGGIANLSLSSPIVSNATFVGNISPNIGGIYHDGNTMTVNNCILWGNTNGELKQISGTLNVSYSIIKGGAVYAGTGNSNLDPRFEDGLDADGVDDTWLTSDDGLHIECNGAAINKGDPNITTGSDISNIPTLDSWRDIGAYEGLCTIYAYNSNCQSVTLQNVKGYNWFTFCSPEGIICSLNPQGLDLGAVTVEVSDAPNSILFGSTYFMGRSINIECSNYPNSNLMPSAYLMRYYFYETELDEYKISVGSSTLMPADFHISWQDGGTGCTLANYGGTTSGLINKADINNDKFGTNNSGFYLEFEENHFTIFAATTTGLTPLFIPLLSFDGKNIGHKNVLNWSIPAEFDNSHFEIERSSGFDSFEKIGEISNLANKTPINEYNFTDETPFEGNNYYRLKSSDINGNEIYSEDINLFYIKGTRLEIYPNPVFEQLNIIVEDPKQKVEIRDILDNVIFRAKTVPDKIDFSPFPKGLYFIRFEDKTFKIVKE